jgi:hypothetical protein
MDCKLPWSKQQEQRDGAEVEQQWPRAGKLQLFSKFSIQSKTTTMNSGQHQMRMRTTTRRSLNLNLANNRNWIRWIGTDPKMAINLGKLSGDIGWCRRVPNNIPYYPTFTGQIQWTTTATASNAGICSATSSYTSPMPAILFWKIR